MMAITPWKKTIYVLLKVLELRWQRKVELLMQKEEIHEEIMAHQWLLLAHYQIEYLPRTRNVDKSHPIICGEKQLYDSWNNIPL